MGAVLRTLCVVQMLQACHQPLPSRSVALLLLSPPRAAPRHLLSARHHLPGAPCCLPTFRRWCTQHVTTGPVPGMPQWSTTPPSCHHFTYMQATCRQHAHKPHSCCCCQLTCTCPRFPAPQWRTRQHTSAGWHHAPLPQPGLLQLPGLCSSGRVLHAKGAGHHAPPGREQLQQQGGGRCAPAQTWCHQQHSAAPALPHADMCCPQGAAATLHRPACICTRIMPDHPACS